VNGCFYTKWIIQLGTGQTKQMLFNFLMGHFPILSDVVDYEATYLTIIHIAYNELINLGVVQWSIYQAWWGL
ncbi:MAG: hypothetical protein WD887_01610, partial [Candidatus Saccharimonadales bacterium]